MIRATTREERRALANMRRWWRRFAEIDLGLHPERWREGFCGAAATLMGVSDIAAERRKRARRGK